MELFYREMGEGTPLVILHGLFGSSDNWITLGRKFSETHKVYIIDQRNHGQTSDSDIFNYAAMVGDLYDFLVAHQIEKPVILGHSMGGKVAMEFATKYPTKLEQLIIVDIAPKAYPVHHYQILEGLASIDLPNLKSRKEADKQLAKYISILPVRQFLLKNIYRTENNTFAWRINIPVISANIERIAVQTSSKEPFEKPTLFIDGGNSDYIQPSDYQEIKIIFPKAIIKTIDDAGHWVHAEKPNEFLDLVFDFLKK